jgi:hypothetical protein
MALKEHPNEWEGIPKETVIDWLDNPCTRFMRSQIEAGLLAYDGLAVEHVNSFIRVYDEEFHSRADQIRVGKAALKQSLNLLAEAEAYVKA